MSSGGRPRPSEAAYGLLESVADSDPATAERYLAEVVRWVFRLAPGVRAIVEEGE